MIIEDLSPVAAQMHLKAPPGNGVSLKSPDVDGPLSSCASAFLPSQQIFYFLRLPC